MGRYVCTAHHLGFNVGGTLNDLILAAMHEQSEHAIFTDLRQPWKWYTTRDIDWAIGFTNDYPTAEFDTGYIFS